MATERRGMDAIAAKAARKKPVFFRKQGPAEEELGSPVPPPPPPDDAAVPAEGIECPKCGLLLVDTPEARAYVAAKDLTDDDMPGEYDDE